MIKFPYYKQADSKDCGPTCLKIIAKHYGKTLNIEDIRFFIDQLIIANNQVDPPQSA